MKLRSARGRRTPERARRDPGPRSPRALRLQKARDERRERAAQNPLSGDAVEITAFAPRTGETAAAVALFGGLLLIALPQHAATIVRVLLVALATVAALWAIGALVPEGGIAGWWRSPFERPSDGRTLRPSGELDRVRRMMAGRRRHISGGRPLPPDTIRLLQPLIVEALARRGLDASDPAHRTAIRGLLSPLAWRVLVSDPRYLPRWYETRRPDMRRTADAVRQLLDELERLRP